MTRILVIDDEPIYHKMIEHSLKAEGYDLIFALNGNQALSKAEMMNPDIIITDVVMPDVDGYEITRRIRKIPKFAQIPIIVLTSQAELKDKLSAFEAGADDYMGKPFQPEELIARLGVWVSRSEMLKAGKKQEQQKENARLIAVHSLRGGLGCSSLALNMAMGLWDLWRVPALMIDAVLTAGQIALMLNTSLRRTWDKLSDIDVTELDIELLQSVIGKHESGLHYLSGPSSPVNAETLKSPTIQASIDIIKSFYEYVVIDTPHDFSETAMIMLDEADYIFLLMAPEMASVRAASAALNTYWELGYPRDKVKIVMNHIFEASGLNRTKIEKALNVDIDYEIPYSSDTLLKAINVGSPILSIKPNDPLSILFEDMAYQSSKDKHRKAQPPYPTETWKRVNKRMLRSAK